MKNCIITAVDVISKVIALLIISHNTKTYVLEATVKYQTIHLLIPLMPNIILLIHTVCVSVSLSVTT